MSLFTRLFRKSAASTQGSAPAVSSDLMMATLAEVSQLLGDVFGDSLVAKWTGEHFDCKQADSIARALILLGQYEAAVTWLTGHAEGDDDPNDTHRIHEGDHPMGEAEAFEYARRELTHS